MRRIYILLIAVVILAAGLRLYRLDSVPPSLSWDEAAVGFNAYTIANNLRDEYGTFLPLFFKSFGEDKQPIHIYATALFVKLFGLSEFSTRIPIALVGSLNVLLIYFLTIALFNNKLIGIFSALFLTLSPQSIFFSRFNHEANFALFFFMLGLLLFYRGLKKSRGFSPLSFFVFLLSTVSYHAAELVVPPVVFLLFCLYFKEIIVNKANILIIAFLLTGFVTISIFNPQLLGGTRYNQTAQGKSDFEKTVLFRRTHNYILGRINLIFEQYSWHFDPKFLFLSGDKNSRLSSQQTGEFYIIDALFLVLGIICLIRKRTRISLVLLTWAFIAPFPSALVAEAPHAARSMFVMGSWQIISALGFYSLIHLFKKTIIRWITLLVCLIILIFSLIQYLNYYFNGYPKRYAIDWQYGMKQIVEYVKDNPQYSQVFTTDARSQPYIFFLYYLKTPLPEYLSSVVYNRSESNKSYNNVSYFDRYHFGDWDPIESIPLEGVLYVLTPSQYDGLKYKLVFQVKKVIYYPNDTTAFYIVGVN